MYGLINDFIIIYVIAMWTLLYTGNRGGSEKVPSVRRGVSCTLRSPTRVRHRGYVPVDP